MPRSGCPKAELTLTDDEREALQRLARRVRTNRDLATRAKIVIACAEDGVSDLVVAEKLHISNKTVGKWRNRFIERRLEGLLDEPRPGAPRKYTDEDVEKVVVQTLEAKPKGRTHWSTRSMAKAAGMSPATVGRIWRALRLQPHIVRGFKISNDPQFVEKVRDVVGLYVNPPEHAVVFAVDEKPQLQALERAQPILPMDLGMPERQTHNYIRHGTLDLFAALDVATGKVIAQTKTQHRAKDFVSFLREIDRNVEDGLDVHIILDNLSTHKAPEVHRWLVRHPHFHLHFTPTYSSWLNLVERFFGLLTEHALKRGSHTSVPDLRRAINAYLAAHNEDSVPFKWTKTADEILESVKRCGERILKVHSGAPQ
jgi:transposase